MSLKTPKVFCIGMHKTGTTSMGQALKTLGYTVMSNWGMYDSDIDGHLPAVTQHCLANFDAFQDHPWAIIYKDLDKQYPNSKFILTTRETESWYTSVINFFGPRSTLMRRWIYGEDAGAPLGNKKVYTEYFERHTRGVLEYFQHRPDDLLVLDLSKGNSWEKICGFLNTDVPQGIPFPHANKRGKS